MADTLLLVSATSLAAVGGLASWSHFPLSLGLLCLSGAATGVLISRQRRTARLVQAICADRVETPRSVHHGLEQVQALLIDVGGRLSNRHPVTGLPTREHLFKVMDGEIAAGCAPTLLGALRLVDFDRLSAFDQCAADRALAALSQRLANAVAAGRLIAHVDRDCLAIWYTGIDPTTAMRELRALVYVAGQEVHDGAAALTPSIETGVALYPQDGEDGGRLLLRARAALARPDILPSGEIRLPQPPSPVAAREQFTLEQDLARAIIEEQLTMAFQPVVDLAKGRMIAAEALLRWDHPSLGRISPARFFPIVEDLGLSERYGLWVLNSACREAKRWRDGGLADVKVAVNLSAHQLLESDLKTKIERTLSRHGLPANALELELTETAAMADAGRTLQLFAELRAAGISLSIDDFGSGYSSLSYLKNLPFDKLKIDREFITQVDQRADSRAICKALVELGRGLGLTILAEGVETESEVEVLLDLGCHVFQGYHFSKPVSGEEILPFAASRWASPSQSILSARQSA